MKVFRIALIAVLSLLAAPTGATAQDAAPPGNAAVDQYRESAPPASSNSRKLTAERRRALANRGSDGAALAAALDRNGGVPTAGGAVGPESSTDGRVSDESGGASGDGGSSGGGAGGSNAKTGRDASDTSGGPEGESSSGAAAPAASDESATKAAASSTVGPLPVWAMLVAALGVVAAGLLLRRRAAS